MALVNNVTSISKGDSAVGTHRNHEPNKLIVFGKCKDAAGPFDVAIERPAAYFGFLLFEHLVATGIDAKRCRFCSKECWEACCWQASLSGD